MESIRLCKVIDIPSSLTQLLVITHSITVHSNLSWKVYVHNHEAKRCAALSNIHVPLELDERSINELIRSVYMLHVCAGHPDHKFLSLLKVRKGNSVTSQVELMH